VAREWHDTRSRAPIRGDWRSRRNDRRVDEPLPRPKVWQHPRLLSEHAFDKLRLLDCTFAEFDAALADAEVIEERQLGPAELKELVLVVDWKRPLHVVVIVDDEHEEERVLTVYEPDPDQWSSDYRRRR
jgi:hypothetical protein